MPTLKLTPLNPIKTLTIVSIWKSGILLEAVPHQPEICCNILQQMPDQDYGSMADVEKGFGEIK
jgi:hypothetical protein